VRRVILEGWEPERNWLSKRKKERLREIIEGDVGFKEMRVD